MQCNQPLFCSGFQSDPQFYPYQAQTRYPDVIGEGDVISMRLPDGSFQSYFVPVNRRDRWTPYCNNYYIPNTLPLGLPNNEAWFVRSFLNTYPATGSNILSNNYGQSLSRSHINVNTPNNGFVQKFHNDGWTSTTDLHYFFPCLRRDWARGCASIQVEIPKEEKSIFHYETICNRPCYCNCKQRVNITKTPSNSEASECTETPMCIDEVKSTQSCCDAKKKQKNKKNKNHMCACHSKSHVNKSDKAVTTYTDQAISCINIKGRECQTGKRRALARTDIETEVWYPRACDSGCSDAELPAKRK